MHISDVENPDRRQFLRALPAAAAAGIVLGDASLFGLPAAAQETPMGGGEKFEVITAEQFRQDASQSEANPGTKPLFHAKTFSIVMTSEKNAFAKEFEWHEHRDHIFFVVEGTTTFHLGGTPQQAHSPRPGEWLAPSSEGAKQVTLHKGDRLMIPRGTPHKRDTAGSVTFTLTAPMS